MAAKVPVHIISLEIFGCTQKREVADVELIEEPEDPFVSIIPEVSIMAVMTDRKTGEIPTRAKFITAQFSGTDHPATFTSVGKWKTPFHAYSDGVLDRVSRLDRSSQRVVLASLRSRFFHLCHYFLLTVTLTIVKCTTI